MRAAETGEPGSVATRCRTSATLDARTWVEKGETGIMTTFKNYTSEVPVVRTVTRIEKLLTEFGVTNIMKQYDDGNIHALLFTIPCQDTVITIRFPANVEAVYEILKHRIKRPRPGTLDRLRAQAARTAWKLMQDWIEVQLSLVQMEQIDLLQVFLSYVWDGQTTFYEALKTQHFQALNGKQNP